MIRENNLITIVPFLSQQLALFFPKIETHESIFPQAIQYMNFEKYNSFYSTLKHLYIFSVN